MGAHADRDSVSRAAPGAERRTCAIPPPARVLLLGSFPPQTQGISGYCGALATALARHVPVEAIGFKAMYPRWAFPGEKVALDPTAAAPRAPGLRVRHVLAWYNPAGWLWHAWRTPADIVHIQWWSLPLFPLCLVFTQIARWRGLPVVVTAHNVLPHEPSPWFVRASRMLYRRADHLVVHSETNRAQLLDTFDLDPSRVSHVPMGVKAEPQTPPGGKESRRALGLPLDRPILLFFGIIRPYKGVEVLLRAMAAVRDAHPSALLVIAGKPWDSWAPRRKLVEDLSLERNVDTRLRYIPEDEVPAYFAAADLVILPYTHFDAQSAVGVQCLGHGKPIIVTNTGGLPDLVNRDPRWCVPPRDPEVLGAAISAFLDDPEGGGAAFATMRKESGDAMGWETSAAAHARLYGEIAGRAPC